MKRHFYQYALNPKEVVERFETRAFNLVEQKTIDEVKGLKDEIGCLKPPLQWAYDNKSLMARIIRKAVNTVARHFANHEVLFIFRKRSSEI